jgi:hypothetical protein
MSADRLGKQVVKQAKQLSCYVGESVKVGSMESKAEAR